MYCRLMNIGPDASVQRPMQKLRKNDPHVSVRHIETGTLALDILSKLPPSEVPDIVVIAFRLPILNALDFIRRMNSYPHLCSVAVFVWGPAIRPGEIEELYRAGAACVFVGQFDLTHVDALHQFCRRRMRLLGGGTESIRESEYKTNSAILSKQEVRNARLGTTFLLTGSISAGLWILAFLQPGGSTGINFVPTPIYAALLCAGLWLMHQDRLHSLHLSYRAPVGRASVSTAEHAGNGQAGE